MFIVRGCVLCVCVLFVVAFAFVFACVSVFSFVFGFACVCFLFIYLYSLFCFLYSSLFLFLCYFFLFLFVIFFNAGDKQMDDEGRFVFKFDSVKAEMFGFKVPLPKFFSDEGFVAVQVRRLSYGHTQVLPSVNVIVSGFVVVVYSH